MTELLHVGQFGIVDHEPVDRGPSAGIFHGKGPAGERAELFVVAEGTTPAGEAFAPHVVSAIGELWSGLDMSVTGALQRCFDEAERNVADWNKKSIAQHRAAIGLTCLARKGDQAVIAQAGPAIAFHLSDDGFDVFEPAGEHAHAFGSGQAPQPEFTRIDIGPGDRVLILSTVAMLDLDPGLVRGILGLPGAQVLHDLYRRVQHLRNLTVLMVELPRTEPRPRQATAETGESEDDVIIGAPSPAPRARRNSDQHAHNGLQPSLFIDNPNPAVRSEVEAAKEKLTHLAERARIRAVSPLTVAAQLPPLQRAVGDTGALRELAAAQSLRASASQASAMAVTTTGPMRTSANAADERGRPVNPVTSDASASFSRGLIAQRAVQGPDLSRSDAPLASELAASRRSRQETPAAAPFLDQGAGTLAATTLVRPRSTMGGRWRTSGSSARRSAVRSQAPSTRIVVVVGLALLIALVGLFTIPGILNSSDEARVQDLVDTAKQRIAAAGVLDNPAERRTAYTEAKVLLLEAQQLGGATTDTQTLINEVAGAISALDAVTAPQRVEPIADFSAFGPRPVTPTDISIGPGVAYLLDTTSAQVIAQPLDGAPATVVYRENAKEQLGRPTAVAFNRAGTADDQRGALLIADANGALWSHAGNVLKRMTVSLPAGTQMTDIAVANDDLYILDAQAGRVLRLTGAGGTFPYEATVALGAGALKSAVRFMVDDEIITSDGDGTLRRYSGDLALVLSQAGIDKPLAAAAAPWPINDGHVAIADPANDRVVVLNRNGTFVKQYRDPAFAALTTLAMRDDAGFVFANGRLLRITW